ncbi:PEP-CTERM sorting domain-containing protein [Akkermansiaceae bacterium]|nr:PEP-CTERM sorting domain-containing protein [Akkermansiaceae bacterium]
MRRSLMLFMVSTPVAAGVSITEFDDFNAPGGAPNPQESWREGDNSNTFPFQQLTGGPDDSGYLLDWSNGSSRGGRVQLWNTDQWTGDYLGQSILSLSLDAINMSGVDGEELHFRVAFNGPGGWFVTAPQTVLPEAGWQSLLFDLSLGALEYAGEGNGAYDSTMSAVSRMQIISLEEGGPFAFGANSGLRGELKVASWGLDNIQAGGGIPEPSSAALMLLGCAGLLRRRR